MFVFIIIWIGILMNHNIMIENNVLTDLWKRNRLILKNIIHFYIKLWYSINSNKSCNY